MVARRRLALLAVGLLVPLAAVGCGHRAPATQPARAGASLASPPVITRLVGRQHIIVITAGPAGPLYSVQSASGAILVSNASLDELRQQQPDLHRLVESALAPMADTGGRDRARATAAPARSADVEEMLTPTVPSGAVIPDLSLP